MVVAEVHHVRRLVEPLRNDLYPTRQTPSHRFVARVIANFEY